jgi:predicted nucleic acid-binding protein
VILVDTSVWVDHFRHTDHHLRGLLDADAVSIHPFVIGELALGNLHPRTETLQLLQRVPQSDVASNHELLHLIEHHRVFGMGIGFVDTHLLAASKMMATKLWTYDKRLYEMAERLGVAYRAAN